MTQPESRDLVLSLIDGSEFFSESLERWLEYDETEDEFDEFIDLDETGFRELLKERCRRAIPHQMEEPKMEPLDAPEVSIEFAPINENEAVSLQLH